MNDDKKEYLKELSGIAIGEAIVSLLTVAAFYLIELIAKENYFDYTVITGAALGAVVVIVNFLILSVSINRAVNEFITVRGNEEMTEEQADELARKYEGRVKIAVSRSYLIRTALTVATLIGAFLLAWFDPIATAIPLFAYKPVLYLSQLIRQRRERIK